MSEAAEKKGTAEEGGGDDDDVGSQSLSVRFQLSIRLVQSDPIEAIRRLEALQCDVSRLALFSANETLDDLSTKSLPLLSIEHHLGMARLGIPTGRGESRDRKASVVHSMDLFSAFLRNLERLEILSKDHARDFHELLESTGNEDVVDDDDDNNNSNSAKDHHRVHNGSSSISSSSSPSPPHHHPRRSAGMQREAKIARFRAKMQAEREAERLRSLQKRRGRLDPSPEDEMDGYDQDGLERALALTTLHVHAGEALEEWYQVRRELPMIEMAIRAEGGRRDSEQHRATGRGDAGRTDGRRGPPPPDDGSRGPLQVTRITQDSTTGALRVHREEIKSKVFQPGWNQPTMTLRQLGELERAQALEREERQRKAEAAQKSAPRRLEQLVKDGLEDNNFLVDASAKVDREWDDWKDENPKGSGNKLGDRGDRNF